MAHYLEFSNEEYEDQCEVASFLLDYWEKEYDKKINQQLSDLMLKYNIDSIEELEDILAKVFNKEVNL